jgi:hypothetical protein
LKILEKRDAMAQREREEGEKRIEQQIDYKVWSQRQKAAMAENGIEEGLYEETPISKGDGSLCERSVLKENNEY